MEGVAERKKAGGTRRARMGELGTRSKTGERKSVVMFRTNEGPRGRGHKGGSYKGSGKGNHGGAKKGETTGWEVLKREKETGMNLRGNITGEKGLEKKPEPGNCRWDVCLKLNAGEKDGRRR